MKKKKLIYGVLGIAALSIMAMSACGGGGNDSSSDGSSNSVSESTGADSSTSSGSDSVTLRAEIFVPVASVSLKVGGTRKLNACIQNADTEEELSGGTLGYASSDPASVSVSDSGELTALKTCKDVVITVSGTYDGLPLESVAIPVTVTEEMSLSTNVENDALSLYTAAGRDEQNPLATSYELNPTVTVDGKTVTDAAIEIISSDPETVSVENKKLTALKVGTATITIHATSAGGTKVSAVVEVTVRKPITQKTYAAEPVIDLEKGTDWSVFDIDGTPTELRLEGMAVTYRLEEGKLTVENSPVVGDNLSLSIELEGEIFEAKVTVATMTVSNREEFHTFAERMTDYCDASKTPIAPYVLLTADIDCEDSKHANDHSYAWTWFDGGWFNHRNVWRGVLNGNGHTINDVNIEAAFMFGIAQEGIVKNLAVTNIRKWATPRGIVAGELYGRVENCYFHVSEMIEANTNSWSVAFATQVRSAAVVKNVVVSIPGTDNNTLTNYKNKNSILEIQDGATVENLYVVVKGNSGKLTANEGYNKKTNGGMFESVYDFAATSESKRSEFGEYWSETGTLIFKSAVKYFKVETGEGKTITAEGRILLGGSTVLKTNFEVIRWAIAEETEGISINNGVLSIDAAVEEGTKFKVLAVGYDKTLGTEYTAESEEFTVEGAEIVALEGTTVTGANRARDILEIDMSEKKVVEIVSVTYVGTEISAYTLSGSIFKLELSALGVGKDMLVVSAKTESGSFCNYTKEIEKADFAIGNVGELMSLADKIGEIDSIANLNTGKKSNGVSYKRTLSSSEYLTVVLTDDVDCRGFDMTARTGKVEFVGSFDGRGHTLFNLRGTDTLFPSFNGTSAKHTEFKNVAFVGAVVTATNTPYLTRGANADAWGTGGYFTYAVNKSLIHDVYLDVTVENCTDKQFGMMRVTIQTGSNYSLYGNIVAVVNYAESCNFGEDGLTAAITVSQPSGFINCHVVSNVTPTATRDEGCFSNADTVKYRNLGIHRYATVAEMMEKITDLPAMPQIPEKPEVPQVPESLVEPIAPTAPADDASEEEKAAYAAALEAYNKAKAAYDVEKAKFDDESDETYKAYREALAAYDEKKAAYDAVMVCEDNRLEKAYNYLKNHADGFSSELWAIFEEDDKKVLIFRSAEIADFVISSSYPDGKIATDTPVTFTAFGADTWTVEGLQEGTYTLENSVLILSDAVAGGTQFTMIAEYTDMFGKVHTAEKQLTVESLEKQEKTFAEILVGKNRSDVYFEIAIENGEIPISVTVNGEAVDFAAETGKVILSYAMLKRYDVNTVYEVKVVTVSDKTVTTYSSSLSVWDFAVGTVEEWKDFERAKDTHHSANQHLYVALTADLDFGGEYVPPRKDSDSWYSLDGKGHMIRNVIVSGAHSFLGDVRGTVSERAYIRNVIFKNLTQKDGHGGLLCLDAEYCDFENLYIEGTISTTTSTLIAGGVGRDTNWTGAQNFTFKNVIINVTFASANQFNAVVAGTKMSIDNVYAISSTSNGKLGGAVAEGGNVGLYQTVAEFYAAKANIVLGDAWTMTDNELKLFGRTVLTFDSSSQSTEN